MVKLVYWSCIRSQRDLSFKSKPPLFKVEFLVSVIIRACVASRFKLRRLSWGVLEYITYLRGWGINHKFWNGISLAYKLIFTISSIQFTVLMSNMYVPEGKSAVGPWGCSSGCPAGVPAGAPAPVPASVTHTELSLIILDNYTSI